MASSSEGSESLRAVAEACKKQEWSKAIRIINSIAEVNTSPLLLW
jgi:hypothetical protein